MSDLETYLLPKISAIQPMEDARRTIELARIRCLRFPQLVQRLRKLPSDDQASEIVLAIIEAQRNGQEDRQLVAVLHDLLLLGDRIPSQRREWLERQVGRILKTLPPRHSWPLVRECLLHRRKSRRTAGFRALSLDRIDEDISQFLLERFKATGDDRFLKVLLNHPLQLGSVDPRILLDAFDGDGYWMMRTIEAVLRSDLDTGESYAATHRAEFIWAAGRIGDERLVSKIADCLEAANDKLPLVAVVAWAFGRLNALEHLQAMQTMLDELARQHAIE